MDGILDFYNHSEEWTARNTEVKYDAYTSLIWQAPESQRPSSIKQSWNWDKNETKKERGKKEKKCGLFLE